MVINTLTNKVILCLLFTLCIVFVQSAYAELGFLSKFGTMGSGDGQLNNPTDVIYDKLNKIHVVDSGNNRISVYDYDKSSFDFTYGTFCDLNNPEDCISNNDNILGAGQFNNPTSIAYDSSATKYFVLDSDNQRVQVFNKKGEFESSFDSKQKPAQGTAIQKLSNKILISNTSNDSIYIFDSTRMSPDHFNSYNGIQFDDPTNMIIDADATLYVSDTGNNRIVVFDLVSGDCSPDTKVADGVCFDKMFGTVGTGDGQLKKPMGLAYNFATKLLYVSDSENNRIVVFEMVSGDCPTDTKVAEGVCFVETFGTEGTGNGEFKKPMGLAHNKNTPFLFVADSENNRVQVLSLDSASAGSSSTTPTTTPTTSANPGRPIGLDAIPASPTSIFLSWKAPRDTSGITEYKIEYKIDSEYVTVKQPVQSNSTSFIHNGLESDKSYSYRVSATNSKGTGDSTSATTAIKPKHTDTPVALTATAISPTSIKLSWLPPSNTYGQPIGGYIIYRIQGDSSVDVGSTSAQTTTYPLNDLDTDTTYTYVVAAKIPSGKPQSEPASATPRADSTDTTSIPIQSTFVKTTEPSSPTQLSASAVSSTQINLTWIKPTNTGNSPITGYKIEIKQDTGQYTTLVADTASTTVKYSANNLVTNSKYTFKVSAINVIGPSEPSNESYAIPVVNFKINPLRDITIDEGKLIRFTVRLVDDSITNEVFSLENSPPAGATIVSGTGAFSWTPTSSEGGKTYTFDIVAKGGSLFDRQTINITVTDVVITPPEPEELGLASFVDGTKDAQSYVDRYNTEDTYKEWFDTTFSQYDSIYQAVGLEEPSPEPEPTTLPVLASFVDETKDPQIYVDRYNTEDSYKAWFDANYADYDSIYHAVGLEEPQLDAPKVESETSTVEEKKFGICGPGTKLIDGVCTIVDKPTTKSWWKFW